MNDTSLCKVAGCSKPKFTKSVCSMHEARMRRAGSYERRVPKLTLSQILNGKTRFGCWLILSEGPPYERPLVNGARNGDGVQRTVNVICDCGTTGVRSIQSIKSRASMHCGCKTSRMISWHKTLHGKSQSAEHKSWSKAKSRCFNQNDKRYKNYGGRGIKMHPDWVDSFECFYAYMGARPEGYSLERVDVNGDYAAGNCKWATSKEQSRNTTRTLWVDFNGRKMSLCEACEIAGVPYKRTYGRLRNGLSLIDSMA